MTDGRGERAELDQLDAEILAGVAAAFALVDPPPADLDDRVIVSLASARLDAEIAHLVEDALVRSTTRATARVRTVRFASDGLEVLLQVGAAGAGTVRVDGWLAPPGPADVELRTRDAVLTTTADDAGRFVLDAAPAAAARLAVRRGDVVVVTTAIRL